MKSFTVGAIAAALASGAVAAPLQARQAVTDADILNYALTLEHLEATFYRTALGMYSEADFAAAGYDSTVYNNIERVASDEVTHVNFLTAGLKAAGAPAVAECQYDFGLTGVKSFFATASVLEGVGVSAYLGAASLIMSKEYLTDAASILTVESRHSAYIRSNIMESPFPAPFDTPLDLDEVYSLASAFITSCPASNPALPVKAFPALAASMSNPSPLKEGDVATFSSKTALPMTPGIYGGWFTASGPVIVAAIVKDGGYTVEIPVPQQAAGQSYVVVNTDPKTVTDENILAGPGLVEVQPMPVVPAA